ncbi:MAG: polyprenyl synthetase family protein [Tepidimonas sp.]|uniref:polyprenyl synthetase family protein n=1 Tax=Tepidimonas sp. TaxID=2002775 RepID=UPI00298EDEFC|nr:farnesyl diphosphate synthase [Tepidimonas sp.]MCS6810822.1 polyprenyl synthetase family protein [Tepidimonas sp.]MDW8337215.1 polyprenyl synthetase family protein [Tepidimonas sp.]
MTAVACASTASWVAQTLGRLERWLDAHLPSDAPAGLGDVMRYAVLDGGKRLRPLLVLAAWEAASGATPDDEAPVWWVAGAVELIHAYSLVHDDLPCMDDDVLRRGKPTVHVRYGQAQALLAGDALQALAFEWLLAPAWAQQQPQRAVRLASELAQAAGCYGMAGGQALDLAAVGQVLDQTALEDMHRRKTGALLRASVRMGALAAGWDGEPLAALDRYGRALGLAFQVMDDVLDATADTATLGKTAGKDAAAGKPTFVSLLGVEAARAYAERLLEQALAALAALPADTVRLGDLARWVVQRQH